jgi:serine/threonine-protein kinase
VICLRCGATVPDGSRFCGRCGLLVSDPQVSTVILEGATGEAEIERLRHVFAGDFDVEHEVGRGGMGVIYRATEVALQRPVALKVLAPGLGTAPRSTERFRREARVVAELEHPNIVPVYRVGQVGGVLYIAMKLVDGRALDSILRAQGPLTVPVALYVLRAAGRALAYAHKRAIVHRDIKSANLLVDGDGRVLVTDFGVALHAADLTLTEAGAVIGTPAFMSPEQCAGQRAGPQSDQYALGVVAFEMLAGAVPFESDTIAGYIHHHLHTPPPDLRLLRRSCSLNGNVSMASSIACEVA